jgi:hypothetical protein
MINRTKNSPGLERDFSRHYHNFVLNRMVDADTGSAMVTNSHCRSGNPTSDAFITIHKFQRSKIGAVFILFMLHNQYYYRYNIQ